jgi:uncharacterized membrane protein
MSMSRVVHYLLCLVLFFGMLGGLAGDKVVLAALEASNGSFLSPPNQEEPQIEEKLVVIAKYPVLTGKSGDEFQFALELLWHSDEFREFDIAASGPPNWNISFLGGLGAKEEMTDRIGLKPLEPGKTYPTETMYVKLTPLRGKTPDPGEYMVTFELSSGDIHETVELKAVVTALYQFVFFPATGLLNSEATAGEDNYLSIWVENTGTATLDNIRLSSGAPEGWSITFNPSEVKSLEAGLAQEVSVVIKPPRKTIAGDYAITLNADSEIFSPDPLRMRVTVLTPTIWGWVGILIVLAVIAGLGVIFRRLGRR